MSENRCTRRPDCNADLTHWADCATNPTLKQFSRADLEAAVVAERERCAKIADHMHGENIKEEEEYLRDEKWVASKISAILASLAREIASTIRNQKDQEGDAAKGDK